MPIEVDAEPRVLAQEEFHALAQRVMGVVFSVHNELGRLMEERIYQEAVRQRCELAGLVPARREVEIRVSHGGFHKSYFMDLLLAAGLMLESKTVEALNGTHQAQALQYLLLSGMRHGLLINLRSGSVEKRYVSSTLDSQTRRDVVVHDAEWMKLNDASEHLRQFFLDLLADWGAFLQVSLYREAIMQCFGGPWATQRRIDIFDHHTKLGTHEVCLIADDTALALTALKTEKAHMKEHLQRFLAHTELAGIQWINMDNHDIEFRTIRRRGKAE